jgi:hypothetical protein
MFGSVVLDVSIGVVFVFLTLSLICSAATEALASALKWRSETLLAGIKDLLNDKEGLGLVRDLYNHALINPRSDGIATTAANAAHKPAYIAPSQFADALLDILQQRGPTPDGITTSEQTNQLLSGMLDRAAGDADALKTELAQWFDTAMDRVSGAYKRKAQLCSFIIALAVAVLLNADMLQIAAHLYQDPSIVKQIQPVPQTAEDARKKLNSLGWIKVDQEQKVNFASPHPYGGGFGWGIAALGWLITAVGTLFGAPFWFDMLKSFVNLRGTGPDSSKKPTEPAVAGPPPTGARPSPSAAPVFPAARVALLTAEAAPIAPGAAAIVAACEAKWPAGQSDCSLFVREVAAAVGVTITGNADEIVDSIQEADWTPLIDGVAAAEAAAAGQLAIAGLKGADQQQPSPHGHVVVVVPGPLAHGKYPSAYWGRLGGIGEKNKTINWAWRAADRDRVVYASHQIPIG